MKKFAFLLALIAVFAMSAAAFADNTATAITAVGNQAKTAPTNIGAVSGTVASGDLKANLYFIDKAALGNLTFALSLDNAATSNEDDALTGVAPKLGNADGEEQVTIDWDATNAIVAADNTAATVDANVTYTGVSLDVIPSPLTLGSMVFKQGTPSSTPAVVSLDLIPTAVSINVAAIDTFYTSADAVAETAIALTSDGYSIVGISDDAGTDAAVISWDVEPEGITVAISDDNTIAISAVKDITAKPGTYKGYIVAPTITDAIVVSEDKGLEKVAIAGLAKGDILAAFEVEVVVNPVAKVLEDIKDDENKTEGVNFVVGGQVIPDAEPIFVSEDVASVAIQIVSLDETGAPVAITPASADEVRLGQGETHTADEARIKPTFSEVNGGYVLEIMVTPSDIEDLMALAAAKGATIVETYPCHIDALGEVRGLVYETAIEVDDSKSSGACSMGFGLAAIAGLAALVLKKRG